MEVEEILSNIRPEGFRISKMRRAFVSLLLGSKGPLSAADVMSMLKKQKISVNKTSIYREIEFWMERGFLREIDVLDGKKRYEIHKPGDHHHHLICKKCKSISCVSLPHDLDEIERKLTKTHGFIVTGHILEFFGVCSACAK